MLTVVIAVLDSALRMKETLMRDKYGLSGFLKKWKQ